MSQLLIHPANAAAAAKILLEMDTTVICKNYRADRAWIRVLQEALHHKVIPLLIEEAQLSLAGFLKLREQVREGANEFELHSLNK